MTQPFTHAGQHTRPVRVRRTVTVIGAAVLAMIVWTICVPALGIELVAGSGASTQRVGPAAVAVVPLIAGALAWTLLAALEKVRTIGRRIWLVIGCVVLALSLVGPITMATSVGALITLLAMHLIVGTTLLVGLFSAGKNA